MKNGHVAARPEVSVIMAVRDGGVFLAEAIASIRAQSYHDWELIVVDDGSTDGSDAVLQAAARSESRLRVIRQEQLGLVAALNRAVSVACGKYLARMDADDRAQPERLGRQRAFMAAHTEVGVLGTAVRRIGAARGVWQRPVHDADLRAALLFEAPFAHPTVMMRRSVWEAAAGEGYREDFRAAEDIDLWERLAPHTKFANLTEPLLDYRVHPGQVTAVATDTMARNGARVRRRWLQQLGLEPTEAEMERHEAVAWLRTGSAEGLRLAGNWLKQVETANGRHREIEPGALAALLGRRWFEYCNAHSRLGWRASEIHGGGLVGNRSAVPWLRRLRFTLLCALRQPFKGGRHD
jgi:hypothetical protein